MKTIEQIRTDKIKAKNFRIRRREFLIDTMNDLIDEEILNWKEIAERLWIANCTVTRIRKDKSFSLSAKKTEEYLKLLIHEDNG